jgi:hypothetical protein
MPFTAAKPGAVQARLIVPVEICRGSGSLMTGSADGADASAAKPTSTAYDATNIPVDQVALPDDG